MTVLLFDLFGVIARQQSDEDKAELVSLAGVEPDRFWTCYWRLRAPYDRGEQDGEQYWRDVARCLGVRFSPGQIDRLITADLASWSRMAPEMLALLAELHGAGARLALLSNIPEELAAFFERTQPWLELFPVRGFSCRIGQAKPSAGAYLWCARALGVPTEQILFIDDRPENVRAAVDLGMRGHVFTGVDALRQVCGTSLRR